VLTSSTNWITAEMKLNQTSAITFKDVSRIDHDVSDVWRIILYSALFLLSKAVKYFRSRNGNGDLRSSEIA